jgi:hypothetical protein
MVFADAIYFKVRADIKTYIVRYDEHADEWGLEGAFDDSELYGRPDAELVTVGPEATREAERHIAGCEACRPKDVQFPFDHILADVMNKQGAVEFVLILTEVARCPNCRRPVSEGTPVEPQGGIEVEALP